MDITFNNNEPKTIHTLVVPVYETKTPESSLTHLQESQISVIKSTLKHSNFTGKAHQICHVRDEKNHIILLGLGDEKKFHKTAAGHTGAHIFTMLQSNEIKTAGIDLRHLKKIKDNVSFVVEFAYGAAVRDYTFDHYKEKPVQKTPIEHLTFYTSLATEAEKAFHEQKAVIAGVHLNRTLLNQPPNVLTTSAFVKEVENLKKLGITVDILDQKELEKRGMNAILSVGRGSVHPPYVAVMQWQGGKKDVAPLAFVGKGVCFDTGGISIKPSNKMDEMKFDMGGAAVVTSLMKTLAMRKAPVNVVGAIGLVENMPDGDSYRPGDIIKSMSGKYIEVLDTDAEGRVVLADVLWYTQDRFKPKFMLDLATLTGAIVVALGHEYAGMFTEDDKLATQLHAVGKDVDEKVWRLPLDPAFAKHVESKVADVRNITPGSGGGSITAAEFLKHFTNGVPWVHLDIAGVAWSAKKHPLSGMETPGYGVRLLDSFIRTYYEGA